MQRIDLSSSGQTALHCPRCGTPTLSATSEVRVCNHLVAVTRAQPGDVYEGRLFDEEASIAFVVADARGPGKVEVLYSLGADDDLATADGTRGTTAEERAGDFPIVDDGPETPAYVGPLPGDED